MEQEVFIELGGKPEVERYAVYAAVLRFANEEKQPASFAHIEMLICRPALTAGTEAVSALIAKFGKNHWTLPGGGLKEGEDEIQALSREIEEEVGILVTKSKAVASKIEPNHKAQMQQDTLYIVMPGFYEGEPNPRAEMDDAQWVNMNSIKNIRNTDVRLAFFLVLQAFSSQLNQPVPDEMYHMVGLQPPQGEKSSLLRRDANSGPEEV